MTSKSNCANCGNSITERVRVEWFRDMVEEVRICEECDSQFTNRFSLFEKEVDEL